MCIRDRCHTIVLELNSQQSNTITHTILEDKLRFEIKTEQMWIRDRLAGVEMAKKVFARFDPTMKVEVLLQDGTHVKKGDIAMIVEGKTCLLYTSHRFLLLQHLLIRQK